VRKDYPGLAWLESLADLLCERGCGVQLVDDGGVTASAGTQVWIVGSLNWYPRTLDRLGQLPQAERPGVLVWHTENLPAPKAAHLARYRLDTRELVKIATRSWRAVDPHTNARRLRQAYRRGLVDAVVVTSEGKREYLEEADIPCRVVPIGWHAGHGTDLGLARDIDVIFLAEVEGGRRKRALGALRRAGVEVLVTGSWREPRFWGEERTRLLNRAKVLLSILRYPGAFVGQRLLLGAANGAVVVSEPLYRPDPWVPGEHYVSAPLDSMPEAIGRVLDDESERRRIADAARSLVDRELTLERSATALLAAAPQPLAHPG
jgi:hypothetical protein